MPCFQNVERDGACQVFKILEKADHFGCFEAEHVGGKRRGIESPSQSLKMICIIQLILAKTNPSHSIAQC